MAKLQETQINAIGKKKFFELKNPSENILKVETPTACPLPRDKPPIEGKFPNWRTNFEVSNFNNFSKEFFKNFVSIRRVIPRRILKILKIALSIVILP